MKRNPVIPAILFATTCLATPALAEDAAPQQEAPTGEHANVLQEIVVTSSRKREEDVQTTPIAVTALNSDMLERSHVENFYSIGTLAPNLIIEHNDGSTGLADIYLRGFGANTNDPAIDPHVAVFYDGIYQPAPTGDLFDMFDVAQLEVQAGPQGTLAGKNAAIGAISVTSSKPTGDFSGEVQGSYGSYDHFIGHAYVNVPLLHNATDDTILATRLSFSEKEGGNWVYNLANGKRDEGGDNEKTYHVAISFTPTSEFSWELNGMLDFNRPPNNGTLPYNLAPVVMGNQSTISQHESLACLLGGAECKLYAYGTNDTTYTKISRADQANVSSTLNYRFEPVTLTSVSGYMNYWLDENFDLTGTSDPELNTYHDRTRYDFESEEIRLSSNANAGWDLDGLLDWVVGGYYSNFNYGFDNILGAGEIGFPASLVSDPAKAVNVKQYERGTTVSQALFAHIIFNLTDQWKATFGVRQSWDHKDHEFQAPGTDFYNPDIPAGFHNTSFEVGTQYQFDPDHMAYVRFAQGYQSGGFSGFANGSPYASELNNEYEIGFKTDWLQKRLRVNLDFFLNELSQLQVESALAIPTPPGYLQQIINAGSATVEGFETQIVAVPTDDITLHTNIGYLHPKYNQNNSSACGNPNAAGVILSTDCSGVPFAYAPKWTIDLGGDYILDLPTEWPLGGGTVDFSADWMYKSTAFNQDPPYPSSKQEGYGLVNLSMTLADPTAKYQVEFFGTNVLNRRYKVGYTDPAAGSFASLASWELPGRPAEWGIKLTYKFGPFKNAEEPAPAPAAPPPEPTPAPPAAPAKAPEAQRQFQVFFDFDKSDITSAAAKVIEAAAEAVKAGNVVQLTVTGHTDTVGSAKYNQALSERRAAAVKGQLVTDGVSAGEIVATGVGKSGLLVPTADGVREPQNRRAEIVLQ